jgi:SAM-dependent methyltransferase
MHSKLAQKILEANRKIFNEIADEFSASRKDLWPELKELEQYVVLDESVLDLGCGNGRLYELFSGKNIDYTGIDYSKNLIQIAKEKYGNKFIEGDILNLPFSEQKFDSVWAIAVLHMIPSKELRKRAVSEIRRVLRHGGRVIVVVWKLKSLFRKNIFKDWRNTGKKRYYYKFNKRELRKLFEESGFEIEELRYLKRNNKKTNILIVAKKS